MALRLLLIAAFAVSLILFTACTTEDIKNKCQKDSDCMSASAREDCVKSGSLSMTPMCIEDSCTCVCGHRDSSGDIVQDVCE